MPKYWGRYSCIISTFAIVVLNRSWFICSVVTDNALRRVKQMPRSLANVRVSYLATDGCYLFTPVLLLTSVSVAGVCVRLCRPPVLSTYICISLERSSPEARVHCAWLFTATGALLFAPQSLLICIVNCLYASLFPTSAQLLCMHFQRFTSTAAMLP